MSAARRTPADSLAQTYPHVARWVRDHGWIEIGDDGMSRSFVRALDEGGLVWEGGTARTTLTAALQELEQAVAAWMREQLGEP